MSDFPLGSDLVILTECLDEFIEALLDAGWRSVDDATKERKDVTTDDDSDPLPWPI